MKYEWEGTCLNGTRETGGDGIRERHISMQFLETHISGRTDNKLKTASSQRRQKKGASNQPSCLRTEEKWGNTKKHKDRNHTQFLKGTKGSSKIQLTAANQELRRHYEDSRAITPCPTQVLARLLGHTHLCQYEIINQTSLV